MRSKNELMPKDLKDICNTSIFKFETTKDIEDVTDLIYGQERALNALEGGIDIDVKGYNLYRRCCRKWKNNVYKKIFRR